jgi:hypothetical protein
MTNIKVAYTDNGPILGDFSTNNTEKGVVHTVENPVLLQQMGQQLGIVPVLGFTKAKSLQLPESEIKYNGELFEPQDELRNHWNGSFGSGIVLATSPASITKK